MSLLESLELANGPGRPVGHPLGDLEMSPTAELFGPKTQSVHEVMNNLPSPNRLVRGGVNEVGIHAVSASAPFVLANQKRVTIKLVGPAIDLFGKVEYQ